MATGLFLSGMKTMSDVCKALGLEGQSVRRLVLEFEVGKVITAYVVLHAKGVDAVPEILARAEGIEFRQVDAIEVRPDATVEVKEQRCKWCGCVIGESRWCPSREQGHEVDASLPPYTGPEADKYAAVAEEAAMRQSYRELTGRIVGCEHKWSNETSIREPQGILHRRTCNYCGMIQVAAHEAVMLGDPDWKQVQA